MLMIELFSGSGAMSEAFANKDWQTVSIDINREYAPTVSWDIGKIDGYDIVHKFGRPDVVWSSPPCEQFSIANHFRAWTPDRKPRTQKTIESVKLHQHALKIIEEMRPKLYFIENPRGMLRTMPWMKPYRRYTVTYCQYGCPAQKPTDIWTNHPSPRFKKPCNGGDPCHMSSPDGTNQAIRGALSPFKNAHDRAVIPTELCEHIEAISTAFMTNPAPVMRQTSISVI